MRIPRSALAVLAFVPAFALAQGVELNTISKVQVRGSNVEISGTKKPNFTTFTMTDPPRLVIDISEAVFSGVPEEIQVGNGVVTAIKTASYGSDASAIARVLVGFEKEYETDIQSSDTMLVVKVLGAGEPTPVAQAMPPAEAEGEDRTAAAEAAAEQAAAEQAAAERQRQDQAAAAKAEADRQREEAAAAKQAEAERKAQEAEAAKQAALEEKQRKAEEAAAERQRQQEEREAAKQAALDEKQAKAEEAKAERARQQEEREAARQAALEEKQAKAEEAAAERQRLKEEREAAKQAALEEKQRRAEEARAAREERVAMADTSSSASSGDESSYGGESLSVSNRRKTLALVGFKQAPNASRVFVRTDEPVRYSVSRGGDKTVILELENTRIARYNDERPLDTSYFDTAVALIRPSPGPTKTVRVAIQLKESVPYEARQEGNEVFIEFQRPPPK